MSFYISIDPARDCKTRMIRRARSLFILQICRLNPEGANRRDLDTASILTKRRPICS